MTNKCVAVLSGGMDSAAAMFVARSVNGPENVHAITFDYGQRHAREIESAKMIASRFAASHQIVNVTDLRRVLSSSSLTSDQAVPHGHYADENMKKTVVPMRNLIMYSIAAGYAASIGAKSIYVGVHAGDHFIYPDCRPEFIISLQDTLNYSVSGCFPNVQVYAPFIRQTKTEIAAKGAEQGVPFDLTWTCYDPQPGATPMERERHCGLCGACQERKEAFRDAGIPDPTVYAA